MSHSTCTRCRIWINGCWVSGVYVCTRAAQLFGCVQMGVSISEECLLIRESSIIDGEQIHYLFLRVFPVLAAWIKEMCSLEENSWRLWRAWLDHFPRYVGTAPCIMSLCTCTFLVTDNEFFSRTFNTFFFFFYKTGREDVFCLPETRVLTLHFVSIYYEMVFRENFKGRVYIVWFWDSWCRIFLYWFSDIMHSATTIYWICDQQTPTCMRSE